MAGPRTCRNHLLTGKNKLTENTLRARNNNSDTLTPTITAFWTLISAFTPAPILKWQGKYTNIEL